MHAQTSPRSLRQSSRLHEIDREQHAAPSRVGQRPEYSLIRVSPYLGSNLRHQQYSVMGLRDGQRRWMLRLVETHFTPARKTDLYDRTPSGVLHIRKPYTLLSEYHHL